MTDLADLTLTEVSQLIQAREVSPVEILHSVMRRVELVDRETKAYITLCHDFAMEQAKVAERDIQQSVSLGPLQGVPISIKDLIDIESLPTTNGSNVPARLPDYDAAVVARLRKAGAVFVGKTNLDEFANGTICINRHFGTTKNPYAPAYSAGGSSGGAAAAVSAGMAYGSIGTDTGGSIRIPAACCGLVGFKPTHGALDMRGITPLAWSEDHVGPIAKSVSDVAILFGALANGADTHSVNLLAEDLRGLRVGIPRHDFWEQLAPEVSSLMAKVVRQTEGFGATYAEVDVPRLDVIRDVHLTICAVEAAAYHASLFMMHENLYPEEMTSLIRLGRAISGVSYAQAQQSRRKLRAEMVSAMSTVDVLMTPTLPTLPPLFGSDTIKFGDMDYPALELMIRNTSPFNVTGFPAISLPIRKWSDGLPAAVQLVSKPGSDWRLLQVARGFSEVL